MVLSMEVTVMPKGDIETYYENGQWKNKVEGSSRAAWRRAHHQEAGRHDRGTEHLPAQPRPA